MGLLIGGGLYRDAGCRRSAIPYDQGDLWAAFAPPLDLYQPRSFERTQCPPLRIGLDITFLEHKVGDYEGLGLAQPLDVPECQPDQQDRDTEPASLKQPHNIYGASDELALDG